MAVSKIAYQVRGDSGPRVLLLHGYAGSVLHWDRVAAMLSSKYSLIVPNLTHVYMGLQPFSFSEQVELLSQFLKLFFPGEKIHLAGISFGGALAWGLALKHPELVGDVILINPMPPAPAGQFRESSLRLLLKLKIPPIVVATLFRTPAGMWILQKAAQAFRVERVDNLSRMQGLHGRKLAFVTHIFSRFSWILRTENWSDWNQALSKKWSSNETTKRTLMVFDPEDPLFVDKVYEDLATQMGLGLESLCPVPGAGHMAIHDSPEVVARAMDDFISDSKNSLKKAL